MFLFICTFFPVAGVSAGVGQFSDISESSEYYDAALFMRNNQIVKGYSDGTFRPYNTITRAEFTKIVLLSEYSQEEINDIHPQAVRFDDVNGSHLWFFNYITFAEENGIINGYPDYTFRPNNTITKGEASKVVVNTLLKGFRIVGIKNNGNWWDTYTETVAEFAWGRGNETLTEISKDLRVNGNTPITRGEMIQVIYEIKKSQNPEISGVSSGEVSRDINTYLDTETFTDNITVSLQEGTYTIEGEKSILVPFSEISQQYRIKNISDNITITFEKVLGSRDKCLVAGGPQADYSSVYNICKEHFVSGAAGSSYSENKYFINTGEVLSGIPVYISINTSFRQPITTGAYDNYTEERATKEYHEVQVFESELDEYIWNLSKTLSY